MANVQIQLQMAAGEETKFIFRYEKYFVFFFQL